MDLPSSTGSTNQVGISDIMSAIFPGDEEVKPSVTEEDNTTETPVEVEEPTTSDVEALEEDLAQNEPDIEPVIEEEIQEEKEPAKDHPEWFQKRIDKLTARAKGAEEQLAALKAEVETLKSNPQKQEIPVTPVSEDNPLADVDSIEGLQARRTEALQAKRWAIMNPDGGTVRLTDGKETFIDSEQVKELRIRAEALIDEHIPKRANFIGQYNQFQSEAKQAYPEIFKPDTEAGQARLSILRNMPFLKQFPDYDMLIGHAYTGMKIYAANKAKASAKPAVKTVKTAPKINPGSSAPKATKASTSLKSGKATQTDIINYITELL